MDHKNWWSEYWTCKKKYVEISDGDFGREIICVCPICIVIQTLAMLCVLSLIMGFFGLFWLFDWLKGD